MKTITVSASKKYDILIGSGLLDESGALMRKTAGGESAAVIMDDNVSALYGERLAITLKKSGYRVAQYVFPHGESSKNAETFLSMLNFFADEKLSRTDVAVALGGGVTGDLAGFAAACYMRGIKFAQIPTTLLAMVDSSVGGKTAFNLAAGKNLAGAFYQPELVLCDVSLLSSLAAEVYRDGCAEVIKYGVLADRELFESLETPVNEHYEDVIMRCVEIKRDVVAKDEFENSSRKLLNLGHTVGHAIELLSDYRISHGHAIAAGTAIVARAAVRMGMCGAKCPNAIVQMLRRYDLPENTSYEAGELSAACLSDKKRDGDKLTMIFPVEIGKCVLKKIPVGELESVIRLGLEGF
jgi:3-dehydroquinate synthase